MRFKKKIKKNGRKKDFLLFAFLAAHLFDYFFFRFREKSPVGWLIKRTFYGKINEVYPVNKF